MWLPFKNMGIILPRWPQADYSLTKTKQKATKQLITLVCLVLMENLKPWPCHNDLVITQSTPKGLALRFAKKPTASAARKAAVFFIYFQTSWFYVKLIKIWKVPIRLDEWNEKQLCDNPYHCKDMIDVSKR